MVKDQKIPAKVADEGKDLLERMPRLEARRSLRKEYQRLVDGQIDFDRFTTRRQEILDGMQLARADAEDYAQKVMEAVDFVSENYVKEVKQGDMVAWAIRGLYRRVEEKIPLRIEDRLKKVAGLRKGELLDLLTEARMALGKREDLDKHKDIDLTLQRMLVHLDPYTTYIDPETKAKFDQEVQGHFTGIGIQIRKDSSSDQLLVVTPIRGSPAYKAGLLAGDIITTIKRDVDSKGRPLDQTSVTPTKGLALNEAVNIIKGQPGTDVTLTVKREGVDKPLDIRVTRARIEVESVLGYKRTTNDDWDFWIDRERKIGYVRLTNFANNSYRDLYRVMERAADELRQQQLPRPVPGHGRAVAAGGQGLHPGPALQPGGPADERGEDLRPVHR
jgi:C-terminal processing protease CtpA/Prc